MASPPQGARPEQARRGALRTQRFKVALIVFAIFGLPLILMLVFLALRGAAFEPPFAEQPGGRIAGRTLDEDGAPVEGVDVEVFTRARGGSPELLQRLATDAAGRFAVDLPPLDGCYMLRVGGGEWIEDVRDLTLEDDPFPDVDFTVLPGCELSVALKSEAGTPLGGGRYYLTRAGGMLGLPIPSEAETDTFAGAGFERGGLRPGTWTLAVELEDGTKAEWRLELAPGRAEIALQI